MPAVGGICAKHFEPALGVLRKGSVVPALTEKQSEHMCVLIWVVPPDIRSLSGIRDPAFFCS